MFPESVSMSMDTCLGYTFPVTITAPFYFRISVDATGQRLGVERQQPEAMKLCQRLGFEPGEKFIDNDLSATSGVRRPEFERLLEHATRTKAPIIVWHLDRLLRTGKDLERVIDTGASVYSVHAGQFDLSTPAGRAVARTVTAWSQYEGEQKALRQRTANLQRAQMGKPWWSRRPFGYEMDGTLRKPEAKALRKVYKRVLGGESVAAMARWLNEQGFTTNRGNPWTQPSLYAILTNPRNAGIRVYGGEEVGPGSWEAVVPESTFRAMMLQVNHKRGGGGARTGFLTGLLTCGTCGGSVRRTSRRGNALYMCRNGCVSHRLEWLDEYVAGVAVKALQAPDLAAIWNQGEGDDSEVLQQEANDLRVKLDELSVLFADGTISATQLASGSTRLRERLRTVESSLARAGAGDGSDRPTAAAIAEHWDSLDETVQRTVIQTLMPKIRILSRGKGSREMSHEDVDITWA